MGLRCCTKVGEPRTPLLPYDSAVLGTNEVNTLEMASAYGTLATGGQHVDPIPAISISDAQGNVIWQAHPDPKQVVDPKIASVADDILQKVVLYGTGQGGQHRPAADRQDRDGRGLTRTPGSSGRCPQLVTSVWVGFHAGQHPDGAAHDAHPGLRRHVARRDLAALHAARHRRHGAPSPSRIPRVGYVSVAVDMTQDPYCLPNPLHAAGRHPDRAVHRWHAAHRRLHHAHDSPGR